MIVAIDVGYVETEAGVVGTCAAVAFTSFSSDEPLHETVVTVKDVAPYVPGRLFERELPCLLAALDAVARETGRSAETVVIDGNVRLDPDGKPGLGMILYDSLDSATPVIGVAKNPFVGLDALEVLRGESENPLYVTAVGVSEPDAARQIQSMAGGFRLPTLLKRADQLTRR